MSKKKLSIKDLRDMNVYAADNAAKGADKEPYAQADLKMLYNKAYDELALQQSKRDQTIALYVTVVTALIAYVIPAKDINLTAEVKGWILIAAAIIGLLLAIVIIRYRIYKESYWLCCQTLTVMMNIPEEELTEDKIKAIYAQVMKTKYNELFDNFDKDNERFAYGRFVWKNLMSAETVYFIIQALCAGGLFGLGAYFLLAFLEWVAVAVGIVLGLLAVLALVSWYFWELSKVLNGVTDKDRFNSVFGKAWFLHLFVTPKSVEAHDCVAETTAEK